VSAGGVTADGWSVDRRLRYRQLERVLGAPETAGTVLEVGAGPGNLIAWGWPGRVVAVDLRLHDAVDVQADACHLPFRDGAFATVTCIDVLEHLPAARRHQLLGELARVSSDRVVVGGPTGAAARRIDVRLRERLARADQSVPDWLDEHVAAGAYPDVDEIAGGLGIPAVRVDRGLACWAHRAITLARARRGGSRLLDVLGRRVPGAVERLGAIGQPYRALSEHVVGSRPATSVVMATRDRASLVGAAIASVVAQDDPDWELIVVDDGSTDATPEVLAAAAAVDERIRIVRYPEGSGSCGRARNRGLPHVRGSLVAFLDDDNTWRPDHLRRCREALRGADVCMTSVQRYLPDGRALDVVALTDPDASSLGQVDANGLCVRVSVMQDFPNGQGRYRSEDTRLVEALRRRGARIVGVPIVTVDYHFNDASYCYAYEIVEGADGARVVSRPRVNGARAAYGRTVEALMVRWTRVRRRIVEARRGSAGSRPVRASR
jgi:hypothetical protein